MSTNSETRTTKKKLTANEKLAAAAKYYEEKVTVTFPLTGVKDDEEIHVVYNGKNYIIRRGTAVTIPRGVYDIIDASNRQRDYLYRLQAEKKDKNQE